MLANHRPPLAITPLCGTQQSTILILHATQSKRPKLPPPEPSTPAQSTRLHAPPQISAEGLQYQQHDPSPFPTRCSSSSSSNHIAPPASDGPTPRWIPLPKPLPQTKETTRWGELGLTARGDPDLQSGNAWMVRRFPRARSGGGAPRAVNGEEEESSAKAEKERRERRGKVGSPSVSTERRETRRLKGRRCVCG